MSSQRRALGLALGSTVCAAVFAWACDGPGAPSAPGRDGSVDMPPRTCARAAEGCVCEPGTGPVDCYVESELGVCHAGQMYCRSGAWSACEWTRSYGAVSGASAALIGDFTACSTCNPGCARATDEPEETDLTPGNSDGVIWDDEGGITVPGRAGTFTPSCGGGSGAPGGTYEEFCMGSGPLILGATDTTTGTTTTECTGEIASEVFQNALCSCEDLDDDAALNTGSFHSGGAATTGFEAHVRTNGHYRATRANTIGGELTGWGTGLHNNTKNQTIRRSVFVNGPWNNANTLMVGTAGGDMYINGNATLTRPTIDGGAGYLHMPAGAVLTPSGTQSYAGIIREPIDIDRPCACDEDELVDIPAFVASATTWNDNAIIGLDPDQYNGGAGGNVELPCGRFYLTNVDTSSAFSVTATGRTALLIDGDLSSTASLDLSLANDDAEIDVFIAGTLHSGASVDFGDAAHPAKVRVYIGTSGDIDMSAHGNFNGNFYAPRANLIFGGSVNINGSLFVRHLDGSSQVNINYDEAVRELGEECPDPAVGRYWRDYDSTAYCGTDSESRPDWGEFTWDADVPDDTMITFEVRTADTVAGLDTATVVSFEVPPSGSPVNIGDLLVAAGLENHHTYLRVTAVLQASTLDAPLLRSMTLDLDCGFGTSGMSSPEDWSCSGSPPTCTQDCPAEVCDDGADNDCDGIVDCADSNCGSDPICCTGELCGDGISNDCDDLVDWDDDECTCAVEVCTDGLDNDADGLTDCADSTECFAGDACNSWGAFCSASNTCDCPTGSTEAVCDDLVDNDCDGFLDCGDVDCLGTLPCAGPEVCTDGADNDLDGLTDCADTTDCVAGAVCDGAGRVCDGAGACVCTGGPNETLCTDGVDDDCDGVTDCADSDCTGVSCDMMGRVCDAIFLTCRCPTGIVETSCIDGADNDCDGLIDCNDGDCDGVACGGAGLTCDFATTSCTCPGGATETTCGDGFDNDCDFTADCMDSDCNGMACNMSGGVCDFATGVCL